MIVLELVMFLVGVMTRTRTRAFQWILMMMFLSTYWSLAGCLYEWILSTQWSVAGYQIISLWWVHHMMSSLS